MILVIGKCICILYRFRLVCTTGLQEDNFMELHGLADMWFDYRHNKFHWNNFIGLSLGVMKLDMVMMVCGLK